MKYFFSIIFLVSALSVKAQESEDYKKFKDDYSFSSGYVIDKHGNKFDGLIKRKEGKMLYKKVIFVSPYTERTVFRPGQLREYALPPRRFVSDGLSFLEVMQDGKIGLYRKIFFTSPVSYYMSGTGGMAPVIKRPEDNVREEIVYLLKKRDSNSFIRISKKSGFRGRALSMISDCKKLVSDIKNKVISRKDIEEIVYQYNKLCN